MWDGSVLKATLLQYDNNRKHLVGMEGPRNIPFPTEELGQSPGVQFMPGQIVTNTQLPHPFNGMISPSYSQLKSPATTHNISYGGPDQHSRRLSYPQSPTMPIPGWYQYVGSQQLQSVSCDAYVVYQPEYQYCQPQTDFGGHTWAPPSEVLIAPIAPVRFPHQAGRPVDSGTRSTQTSFSTPFPYYEQDNGVPVNLSQGGVLLENATVIIRNLSYKATVKDVADVLSPIVGCEIKADKERPRCRHAIVTFRTKTEARAAVDKFNGSQFMDRKIEVRLTKEGVQIPKADEEVSFSQSKPSHLQGPKIVNGSIQNSTTGYGKSASYHQKARVGNDGRQSNELVSHIC